jgi:acylphosphatase
MSDDVKRAEIIAKGHVQGVGFRWFIQKNAEGLGLKGYAKNLPTGEVQTVAEGPEYKIDDLFNKIKTGPSRSDVRDINIRWTEPKNDFNRFEIKH